ncbi:MAG: pilus assembly protein TadG [Sphingomonadales bacterium]|nr:MAG: pilus assembly protein TadG [Sphingomonadales bacterium]TNF04878.1 MAG: pilus assembly protein TadG [Sphingomonadales bacterium]
MARKPAAQKGFLTRLLHNEAGNTLAITAAATLPLIGMIGGGVDISRLYLVKTRLQQACDAGALAGRKAQGGGNWTTASESAADQIFATNYATDAYGSSGLTHDFTESAGKVTGTASVTVPLMVMKLFGFEQKQIAVSCDAEMRLPNTDIMFVLDVTGSMRNPPTSGGYATKLSGLKTAVQCFYEVLMKLDTPADCGTTPSGGISNDIQVRFGFVPYNVNVNVGRLLPNSFMADRWSYQSREAHFTPQQVITGYNDDGTPSLYSTNTNNYNYGNASTVQSYSGVTSSQCDSYVPADTNNPNGGESAAYGQTSWTSGSNQIVQWYTDQNYSGYDYYSSWSRSGNRWSTTGNCTVYRRSISYTLTRTYRKTNSAIYETQDVFDYWIYKKVENMDVSGLKAGGSDWNNSVMLPIGTGGTETSVAWPGCIEERKTVRTTDFDPIPTDAFDLDIDMVPTSDPDTQWGPMLPTAVYKRSIRNNSGSNTYASVNYSGDYDNYDGSSSSRTAYCPTASRKLARYTTSTEKDDFVNYVNSLEAVGSTYHDIGLLWGARLMSPTGIFASENAFTSRGGEIERHLIFMTDGEACAANTNYSAYGVHWWDRRQTDASTAPTYDSQTCSNDNVRGTVTRQIELRTEAICSAIKNKNITLWVVNYGGSVASGSPTAVRLENCASPNRYYEATSVTDLLTTFQTIAAQISQLRLTN